MEAIIVLLYGLTVTVIIVGLLYRINSENIIIKNRLENYVFEEKEEYSNPELNRPFSERVFAPVIEFIEGLSKNFIPQEKKQVYAERLLMAGNPHNLTPERFIAIKYMVLLAAILMGILSRNLVLGLFMVILAIYLPDFYIKTNQKKRQEEIIRSLPDILDLLNVSVEAGLGFDAALQKVVEKTNGPLTMEFEKTLQEINIGKPRREALRDMQIRVRVDDVTTFLGSVIQADQLGVSITNVLRIQSKQVRENRKMRAEEKAQKTPIKILIPLVLFIFPTIFIVLLGPAMIQLMDTM
ncbi:MAG: type II secretion system F family protein [Syntrophomonas sp.]